MTTFHKMLAGLGIVVATCIVSNQEIGAQSPGLTAFYTAPVVSMAPMWIAKEVGFFKKQGLDVRLVFIASGPTGTTSLLAGETDVGIIGGFAPTRAIVGGAKDLVIIGPGIGEHDAKTRERVCLGLGFLRTVIDPGANAGCAPDQDVAAQNSKARVLVIHTRDAWDATFGVLEDAGAPEQVVFHCDARSGLRAIVGIHSTALGPAFGGLLGEVSVRFPFFAAAGSLTTMCTNECGLRQRNWTSVPSIVTFLFSS